MPATACYVPSGVDGRELHSPLAFSTRRESGTDLSRLLAALAVYLTKDSTPLATDVVIQNQLTIVAGPG